MAKIADKYLEVDSWKIIEDGFHPEKSQVSESLFSKANEHQGVRGFLDEGYSGESLVGVYLNGIYEERFTSEPSAYKDSVGTLYIGGTHPTGNDGACMSAVFGLCGIRCAGDTITIQPHLPAHWKKVSFSMNFHRQEIKILLTSSAITVQLAHPLTIPMNLCAGKHTYALPQAGEITVPSE